jgi:hypothetical protein
MDICILFDKWKRKMKFPKFSKFSNPELKRVNILINNIQTQNESYQLEVRE